MSLDEQIEIIQALKDGKKIETFLDSPKCWVTIPPDHQFDFNNLKYRIVREPAVMSEETKRIKPVKVTRSDQVPGNLVVKDGRILTVDGKVPVLDGFPDGPVNLVTQGRIKQLLDSHLIANNWAA